MNETERAALVDFVRGELWRMNASDMMDDDVHVSIANHIIDRLLAAADAPGLDEIMAQVEGGNLELSHYFGLWKCVMFATVGNVREQVVGHGNSPMDAIRNAVAQATGTTKEGASE